jgi:hypothetical protein
MVSNTLRANLSKHMTLNQRADQKAPMIMTASLLDFDDIGDSVR